MDVEPSWNNAPRPMRVSNPNSVRRADALATAMAAICLLGAWSATYGVDGGFQQPLRQPWRERQVGDEDERVAARCREL